MYNQILVRYGDLTLKGKNKNSFIKKVMDNLKFRFKDTPIEIEKTQDRMFLKLNGYDFKEAVEKLNTVSGLHSYSLVTDCETDLDAIKEQALKLMEDAVTEFTTFKVETKRTYKQFPMESTDISRAVAGHVLRALDGKLKVDVHAPKMMLRIEVRSNRTYVYTNAQTVKGVGGFPTGIAGKGLLMISGGIDSPVAGYLMQKQGVEVEAIHFESTPLTSIESAQKVVDLTKKMAKFAPKQQMKLHMVHFSEMHQELLAKIPESYNITIMRRMMYRIADGFCRRNNIKVIGNGESLGQVASQTLGSMQAVNAVTNLPIVRPLATYDKNEIIEIAKKIDTYDLSILPFEDCCTVYVPKSPTTNPNIEKCLTFEKAGDFEKLVEDCITGISTITIAYNSDLDITKESFEVKEAIKILGI